MPTTPPAAPPQAPSSPQGGGDGVPFDVPKSEEQALAEQLKQAENAGTSVVGQDLKAALGGR